MVDISLRTQVSASHQLALQIHCMPTLALQQALRQLLEQGYVAEPQESNQCPACGEIWQTSYDYCHVCGYDASAAANQADADWNQDDEWNDDASCQELDSSAVFDEISQTPLEERLGLILLEHGWSDTDAWRSAVSLAWHCSNLHQHQLKAGLKVWMQDHLNVAPDLSLATRLQLAVLSTRAAAMPVRDARPDILIFPPDFEVTVCDSLSGLDIIEPKARIQLGNMHISVQQLVELYAQRLKRYQIIGEKLLEFFPDFFRASSREQAEFHLRAHTMTQKAFAEAWSDLDKNMPESTFSVWATLPDGLSVATQHGSFYLGEFFKNQADSNHIIVHAIGIIQQHLKCTGEELRDALQTANLCKVEERRARSYLKMAWAALALLEAPLPDGIADLTICANYLLTNYGKRKNYLAQKDLDAITAQIEDIRILRKFLNQADQVISPPQSGGLDGC